MSLEVTTHVARDLLQSARLFKEDKDVVWEYVVNSLQYVDRGVRPKVQVTVQPRKKVVEIADNGRGMNADDLRHYFQMHGENRERQSGRPGRGKFGTGKSAAFGIARLLRVDTRRNGVRNVVELSRAAIDGSSGDRVPLLWKVQNQHTTQSDGTTVTIEDVRVSLQTPRIVEYIERHLQSFRAVEPEVAVNDHVCTYRIPETDGPPRTFLPVGAAKEVLGEAVLTIQISKAPLTETERGVVVTAGVGNTVAVETGGIERKEFGDYLFGTIDVPDLDREVDGLEAFDLTRSLKLNLNHPVAAQVAVFIAQHLEEVRKELVVRERQAAETEQARRLAREADRIADVLNRDFEELRDRLREIRAAASTTGPVGGAFGSSQQGDNVENSWVEGTSVPGSVERTDPPGQQSTKPRGRETPTIPASGTPDDGESEVDPAGGTGGKVRKPRGGFSVKYQAMGRDADRSQFSPELLRILINLDHPVVAAALGRVGVEDPGFKRLSYEIAFTEYALGIGYRMLEEDQDIPADDLMYEVRSTLNRVSRTAAALYA